jgi:hypothetical protein
MDELLREVALLKDRIYDLELRHARHKHLGDVDQTQKLASTATSPGGSDTQVQFNDGGSFGGDARLTWDKINHSLQITGSSGNDILKIHNNALDVDIDFEVNSGGNGAGRIFAIQNSSGAGPALSVEAGGSFDANGDGGTLTLLGGAAGATSGDGGGVAIAGSAGAGAGDGGGIAIEAGAAGGTSGTGGALNLYAGDGGDGGNVNIRAGGSTAASTAGSDVNITPGAGTGAKNGNVVVNLGGGTTIGDEGLFRIIGSPAGNGPHTVRQIFTIRTTDATPSAHSFLTLPVSRSTFVEVRISARRTGGSAGTDGDSAGYVRRAAYKRSSAGTTTLIGAVQDDFTVEDQAAWDATLVISTNDIQVQVTGAANNNIDWICDVVRISQSDVA